jgi:hypothetical protein
MTLKWYFFLDLGTTTGKYGYLIREAVNLANACQQLIEEFPECGHLTFDVTWGEIGTRRAQPVTDAAYGVKPGPLVDPPKDTE